MITSDDNIDDNHDYDDDENCYNAKMLLLLLLYNENFRNLLAARAVEKNISKYQTCRYHIFFVIKELTSEKMERERGNKARTERA